MRAARRAAICGLIEIFLPIFVVFVLLTSAATAYPEWARVL